MQAVGREHADVTSGLGPLYPPSELLCTFLGESLCVVSKPALCNPVELGRYPAGVKIGHPPEA